MPDARPCHRCNTPALCTEYRTRSMPRAMRSYFFCDECLQGVFYAAERMTFTIAGYLYNAAKRLGKPELRL
jgi:hypothetical protein